MRIARSSQIYNIDFARLCGFQHFANEFFCPSCRDWNYLTKDKINS